LNPSFDLVGEALSTKEGHGTHNLQAFQWWRTRRRRCSSNTKGRFLSWEKIKTKMVMARSRKEKEKKKVDEPMLSIFTT
jgi:hypothetical protein